MDSQANSLINPDARMSLAGAQPGAAAAGALPGAGGVGAGGAELGGLAQRFSSLSQMRGNPRAPLIFAVTVLIAAISALIITLVAAVLPANRAAKFNPVDILRGRH